MGSCMEHVTLASKACSELVKCRCKSQNNVMVDVHVERHVGSVQSFVVVIVRSNCTPL